MRIIFCKPVIVRGVEWCKWNLCVKGTLPWAALALHAGLPESGLCRSGQKLRVVQGHTASVSQDLEELPYCARCHELTPVCLVNRRLGVGFDQSVSPVWEQGHEAALAGGTGSSVSCAAAHAHQPALWEADVYTQCFLSKWISCRCGRDCWQ